MKHLPFLKILVVFLLSIPTDIVKAQTQESKKINHIFKVPLVEKNITIMTDGQIESKEWEGAQKIVFPQNDSCYLLIKQSDDYIFLAVAAPFNMLSYLDLFFDFEENSILNLHSSSQIGERNLTDTLWTERNPPAHWGNSKDWYANETRFDRILAQEILAKDANYNRDLLQLKTNYRYDGFEYLFKKARFNKKSWKVSVILRSTMPGYKDITFPQGANRQTNTWATLVF